MSKPVVFISYSHKNRRLKERIETLIKSTGADVNIWSDRKIKAGGDWYGAIQTAIEKSSIAILIITADFLASDFVLKEEIPKLLQRREKEGMLIFPIIAKSCPWDEHEWLRKMQVRPLDAKPVWPGRNVDKKLTEIVKEIKEMIDETRGEIIIDEHNEEKTIELPFTNRVDEIENVISVSAPPYHIFDAPAGYGKTMLLQGLEKRFQEKKWLTALVNVNVRQEKEDIIIELTNALKLDTQKLKGDSLDQKFGGMLFDKWRFKPNDGAEKGGIVFLFDLKGMPTDNFEYITNRLIPMMREILSDSDFFLDNHNAFRVVFAGRYLSRCAAVPDAEVDFKITKLKPFDLDVIRETISKHKRFREINKRTLSKVAADLIFVTGGHPRCIAKIVQLHTKKGGAMGKYIEENDRYIWDAIVKPVVAEVRAGVPEKLLPKLDELSILRRLDTKLLILMIQEYWEADDIDALKLEENLLGTQLMDRNYSERIIEDGITRRLLSIHLRNELVDGEFQGRCSRLKEFCWQRIADVSLQGPEKWLVEYLFQDIQQFALDLPKSEIRETRHNEFFSHTLPETLEKFVAVRGKNKWRSDRFALLDWIREDWEVCFLVNYYFLPNMK